MTLTQQQRLEAYEWAKYCPCPWPYVCLNLMDWLNDNKIRCSDMTILMRLFPEFAAQRPKYKRIGSPWWEEGDTASRIAALDRAIELVKKKL